jgi:molecular chaperone HtpG
MKKIEKYEKEHAEFKEKDSEGGFVNKNHRNRVMSNITKSREEAVQAQEKIKKVKEKANGLIKKVIDRRIELECSKPIIINTEQNPKGFEDSVEDTQEQGMMHRADKLSQYSKAERKLISKIFEIILTATDSETAEMIIRKIEDGLK